jgi:hypothetical protein
MKQLLLYTFLVLFTNQAVANAETIKNNPFTQKKELPNWDAQIYPNPNNGEFNIMINGSSAPMNVVVFNVIGEKVYEHQILAKNGTKVDLTGMQKGLYVVQIADEKLGEIVTRRMQIR